MPQKHFLISSITEIKQVLAYILGNLALPSLVLLKGDLGSGKTTLTKYLLEQFGLQRNTVKSPTYTLINNYIGVHDGQALKINHLDLYRVEKPDPFLVEEISMLISEPLSITLIEWPERQDLSSIISEKIQLIDIEIRIIEEEIRKFTVEIKP